MTKQTLYSLRVDGDRQWRITKFVDGEVESSYLCTETECECPAGHRPSCRHRQMLPMMLAEHIDSTHWFWDFDLHRVVDFNGTLKSNFDAMNELAAPRDEYLEGIMNRDAERAAPPSEPALVDHSEINKEIAAAEYHDSLAKGNWQKPWRRL